MKLIRYLIETARFRVYSTIEHSLCGSALLEIVSFLEVAELTTSTHNLSLATTLLGQDISDNNFLAQHSCVLQHA